jgi:hypothetical protein
LTHAGINLLAVLIAGFASYAAGALWYGILGRVWLEALEKTKAEMAGPSGRPAIFPFVLALLADLVIAYVLAGAIGHLGPGQVTLRNGVISAGILWLGFVATTIAVNNAFAGRRTSLTLVDAGHWFVAMLIAGAIIGAMGTDQ